MVHLLLSLAWILGLQSEAWAKKVKVEWSPLEGAASYEIWVRKDGVEVQKESLKDPIWKGNLEPGAYSYQIRAVDTEGQPGAWSEVAFLAVMPPPPKPTYPPSGSRIDLYSKQVGVVLKWEPSPEFKKYMLEIRKDSELIFRSEVAGNQYAIRGLPPGKLSWQVKGILESGYRAPASTREKSWETPSNIEGDFRLEYKNLAAPRLVYPLGIQFPDESRKIKLKWKATEGAEAYEVQILKTQRPHLQTRFLASEMLRAERFVTRDTSFVANVPKDGDYVWGVKALAHLDERQMALAEGPESVGRFNLDKSAVFQADAALLEFSGLLSPYKYSVFSPNNSFQGGADSTAVSLRFNGEFWLLPQWGFSTSIDYTNFEIENQTYIRYGADLALRYRVEFGSDQYGWFLSPKLGIEARDYNQIIPNDISNLHGAAHNQDLLVGGVVGGFDLRKQFNDKFSISLRANYFYPIRFLNGVYEGSTFGGEYSLINFSVGLQILYWLNPSFGLGAGGSYELRSIGFTPAGSTDYEKVIMNGQYFYGSMVFRIWR